MPLLGSSPALFDYPADDLCGFLDLGFCREYRKGQSQAAEGPFVAETHRFLNVTGLGFSGHTRAAGGTLHSESIESGKQF